MNTDFSKISTQFIQSGQKPSKSSTQKQEQTTVQNTVQMDSKTSSALAAYGMAKVRPYSEVTSVGDKPQTTDVKPQKSLNIFFFSDTHGELNGLTKLGAAKESCEEFCGGKEHLTVLGSGDLIAGCNQSVINATVSVVNQLGMDATSLGNHERSRSDEALSKIADNLNPELLAINANENDKACSVVPSKVCSQNGIDFITIGAKPLSAIDSPLDIAKAIVLELFSRKNNGFLKTATFLEPCVGGGIFILCFVDLYIDKVGINGLNEAQALVNRIYCADIDSDALRLTKVLIRTLMLRTLRI